MSTGDPTSAPHDVGGRSTAAKIERAQHAFAPWEVRVDAIMLVLIDATRPGGPLMTVDELRRGVESLSPEDYVYYRRWLRSLITIMVEKGAIDPGVLARRAEALAIEHAQEHRAHHA
jgi:hypothetical protein